MLDHLDELSVARDADVEVAVGRQDHAVVAALDVVLASQLIRETDPGSAGSGTARVEARESADDLRLLCAGDGRQNHACGTGVDND